MEVRTVNVMRSNQANAIAGMVIINKLLWDNTKLKKENAKLKAMQRRSEKRNRSFENIAPASFEFYTGLSKEVESAALYSLLGLNASTMKYCDCSDRKSGSTNERQLTLRDVDGTVPFEDRDMFKIGGQKFRSFGSHY